MASNEELNEMFNRGDLGAFLVERFQGNLGFLYPRKDSDFIVTFKSEEKVPPVDSLENALRLFYSEKGYYIANLQKHDENSLEFGVYFDDVTRFSIFVVITTNYPNPQPMTGATSLRVTTVIHH